jgi:hypothetical protein
MNLPSGDPNNQNPKNLINTEITIMIEIIIDKINTSQITNLSIDLRISIQEMTNMTMTKIIMIGVMMIITAEEADEITTTIKESLRLMTEVTTTKTTIISTMISTMIHMIKITTELKDQPLFKEAEEEEEAEDEELEEAITRVTTIEAMIILKTNMVIIDISKTSISKGKKTIIKMLLLMINTLKINSNKPLWITKTNSHWILHTKHTCQDSARKFIVKHQNLI